MPDLKEVSIMLEDELDYYKDAYENRVDEFLNRDRFE